MLPAGPLGSAHELPRTCRVADGTGSAAGNGTAWTVALGTSMTTWSRSRRCEASHPALPSMRSMVSEKNRRRRHSGILFEASHSRLPPPLATSARPGKGMASRVLLDQPSQRRGRCALSQPIAGLSSQDGSQRQPSLFSHVMASPLPATPLARWSEARSTNPLDPAEPIEGSVPGSGLRTAASVMRLGPRCPPGCPRRVGGHRAEVLVRSLDGQALHRRG